MESFKDIDDARSPDDGPPFGPSEQVNERAGRRQRPTGRPPAQLRSTRGGAGSVAGATPKKAYRPSASSRRRPSGKKPDTGPR
jgi:hypothetical protein